MEQEFELVAIDKLKRHPRNPRRGDVAAIADSIRANGFFRPLYVQRSTSFILAGNHRRDAGELLGMTELPVVWLDVDDATALRILLADNRTSDCGLYDEAKLAEVLARVGCDGGGLGGTGYSDQDLERLVNRVAGANDQTAALPEIFDVVVPFDDYDRLTELQGELEGQGLRTKVLTKKRRAAKT